MSVNIASHFETLEWLEVLLRKHGWGGAADDLRVARTELRVAMVPLPAITPRPLTRRQYAILSFLDAYKRANGFAPSFQEIADNFGYRSLATVHEHLAGIERKGWIRRAFNESRAVEIIARPEAA